MPGRELFSGIGDSGLTGLIKAGRYPKSADVFEAIGALDELDAFLSWIQTEQISATEHTILTQVYADISALMGEMAGNPEVESVFSEEQVRWVEKTIEDLTRSIAMPTDFLSPGKNRLCADFNLLRAISRRAERQVVRYFENQPDADKQHIRSYLNRLSSLFFSLMLVHNADKS